MVRGVDWLDTFIFKVWKSWAAYKLKRYLICHEIVQFNNHEKADFGKCWRNKMLQPAFSLVFIVFFLFPNFVEIMLKAV